MAANPKPINFFIEDPSASAPRMLTSELQGNHDVKEEILRHLMGDETVKIGVWGTGGVGKTTIMMHVYNQLLEKPKFKKVIWVTVSETFDVGKIQNEIARNLKGEESLSKHQESRLRAAALSQILEMHKPYVLILDDVWESFELHKVGIPEIPGCKLVLTTRSEEVARKMDCERVKVNPLSWEASLKLFKDTAGVEALPDDGGAKETLEEMVRECDGLPLAIKIVASSMKGISHPRLWRAALSQLKQGRRNVAGTTYDEFRVLKFSYDEMPSLVDDDYPSIVRDAIQIYEVQKQKLQCKLQDVKSRLHTQLQDPWKIEAEGVKLWLRNVEEITGLAATYFENQFNNVQYDGGFSTLVKKRNQQLEELLHEGTLLPESLVVDDYSLTLHDDEMQSFKEWQEKLLEKNRDIKEKLSTELCQNPEKIVAEYVKQWLQKVERVIIPAALDVHNQLSSRHPPYLASLVIRVKELIQEIEELCNEGDQFPESLVVDDISTFGDGNMVLSLQLLIAVTNNFSEENILGRGGFATVYKGEPLDGAKVAVKRMKPGIVDERGLTEFKSEIAILSKVQHRHLVELLGHCIDENERLLVYEYMPRGTLSRYLFNWNEEGLKPLEWTSRLRIALDVARGVEYLHILAHKSYIHRDIKSPNILLGDDMRAKVADFGFVRRAADGSVSVETRVVGTFGYFAPEYFESGRVTRKADVYSLGVVLMELITGRKALGETIDGETFHLVTWFRKMLTQKGTFREAIDQSIELDNDTLASIRTMAKLAGRCSDKEQDQRPSMSHVVRELSSLAENWKPAAVTTRKQPKWWKWICLNSWFRGGFSPHLLLLLVPDSFLICSYLQFLFLSISPICCFR